MGIVIKDPILNGHEIHEDFQGISVRKEGGATVKVANLQSALAHIAQHILLEEGGEVTLCEYTKRKKTLYDAIVKAQNPEE